MAAQPAAATVTGGRPACGLTRAELYALLKECRTTAPAMFGDIFFIGHANCPDDVLKAVVPNDKLPRCIVCGKRIDEHPAMPPGAADRASAMPAASVPEEHDSPEAIAPGLPWKVSDAGLREAAELQGFKEKYPHYTMFLDDEAKSEPLPSDSTNTSQRSGRRDRDQRSEIPHVDKKKVRAAYNNKCAVCQSSFGLSVAHLLKNRTQAATLGLDFDDLSNFIVLCGFLGSQNTCHHLFDSHRMCFQHQSESDRKLWKVCGGGLHHDKIVELHTRPRRRVMNAHRTACKVLGRIKVDTTVSDWLGSIDLRPPSDSPDDPRCTTSSDPVATGAPTLAVKQRSAPAAAATDSEMSA